jgi:hypothetical protein
MHSQINRFKHLPHWFWEIENKEKFRGSSCWQNTAAQQVRHLSCAQTTHNSGGKPVRYWKVPLERKNDAVSKRSNPRTMGYIRANIIWDKWYRLLRLW